MSWACIVLPHLALDCVLRCHPEPDKPLALVGGHPQRRELIAVNAAAERAGLYAGQRLTLAQAILREFATVEHDRAEAARWQRFLAALAYRYSSQVYAGWPSAIVLEVRSSFSLIGDWPQFESRLRADLQALGFRHRIALAPTPRAAYVLASLRDGLAVPRHEQLRDMLGAVPVRLAGLPNDAGEKLSHVGLRRLREVFALPRDGLRRRFGQELLGHLDRMLGDAPEPLDYYQPPDIFDTRIRLSCAIENHLPLQFPVRRLTADLAAYLASRASGVQQFVLRLEHESCPPTQIDIGLLSAERNPALLFELARIRLERTPIPAPVIALRLMAKHLPPFVPTGRDLFDDQPVGAEPWAQTRERLRARLGAEAVYRVAVTADPRPDYAWQRDDGNTPALLPELPPRPTWLLPHPIPLPTPAVRILAGPERLESGWWDDNDVRRDYYVLETAHGQRAWAFTPVGKNGPWMLHGWFA